MRCLSTKQVTGRALHGARTNPSHIHPHPKPRLNPLPSTSSALPLPMTYWSADGGMGRTGAARPSVPWNILD